MKNYFLSVVFLLAIASLHTSCKMNVLKGEGNKTTAAPVVTAFNAVDIDVTTKAVINIKEGVQPGVEINTYENVLKHIKTKVENNKLRIYSDLDETWTMDRSEITVTITMPAIVALSMSGATDADIHGNLSGKEFKMDISGAGTIKMDSVNVDDFSLEISGAADVEVKGGAVKHAEYEINGAGELRAYPLQSAETIATISGAGTSEVTALQKLTANINGAGTIKYKGHPSVSQDVSGVGTIKDAN